MPLFKDYLFILLMVGLPSLFISCKPKTHPNQAMVDLLKEAEKNYNCPDNVFSPDAVVIYCDSILKNSSDENEKRKALNRQAKAYLELGEEQKAIDIYNDLLGKTKGNLDQRQAILKDLAITYLRLGERMNCIHMRNAESCIYPISKEAVHHDKTGSEKAIEVYKMLLMDNPGDLESRWLLNIAYMTTGGYPQQVPPQYLLKVENDDSLHTIKPFVDVAANVGLNYKCQAGGNIVDDFNNDGYPDIVLSSWSLEEPMKFYGNNGNGTFTDRSDSSGLGYLTGGLNMMQTDYNNDGWDDLFVTYWGQNRLYRNLQGKRFEDVTAAAHLKQNRTRYNTGCAFVDIDRDGKLDLFVANYLKFDPHTTPRPGASPYCYYRGIAVNCGPRGLPFDRNLLYRNNGDGTFVDISEPSGIAEPFGHYSLGVLTADFNSDGLPDIYVACDQTPSLLYINKGQNKFEEEGVLRGVAFDQNGKAMSGMGVAAGDYLATGPPSIFRTNFSDEYETLYRNRGDGNFDDVSLASGLGLNTRYVGWGTGFFDFNNDGWPDLFLVNGHAFPEVDNLHIDIHYKDRAILYQNTGDGQFRDISGRAGSSIFEKHSSRGAAFGDIDNDGNVEIAINNQNEPPSLLKQTSRPADQWIILKLVGTRSNRSAIGARVELAAGGHRQTQEVRSGGSYLSQSDLRLHFGLGNSSVADRIEIRWPGGRTQVVKDAAARRVLTIREE